MAKATRTEKIETLQRVQIHYQHCEHDARALTRSQYHPQRSPKEREDIETAVSRYHRMVEVVKEILADVVASEEE